MNEDPDQLRQRLERLQLLYEVSTVIHSTLDPQQALQLIVREAVRLTRASSGSVALLNPTSGFLEIQAAEGLPRHADRLRLRVGEGITGWVTREGQPARVGRVQVDPRYIMLRPGVQSEMAVPLAVGGEISGVINVDSDRPDAFGASDQDLLTELAVHASTVIQNTWLYEQLRLKARLLESLVSVGQTINSTLNMDEALQVITREACQLMEAKMCSLVLRDESREWLELRAHHGAGPAYRRKPRLSLTDSLLGSVVRRQKPLQVENVQTDTRYQHVEIAGQEGLVSLLSVPLLFKHDAIGTLNVYTGRPHLFSNEEIRILSALAELSAIAIEKARLYERIVDAEEQLRQSERLSALGLLAAEVAHEIRNPLTVMKMLYHSLDLKFPAKDPRAKDASMMGEKMDQLNRIVDQILDFARNNEPHMGQVDLNRVLDELCLLTRHKLHQQRVELDRQFAPNLPPVIADAAQLEQAFLNLVLNAVHAMPQGGRLTLTTRADAAQQVVIEFKDTGAGMTPERQRQAFRSLLQSSKPGGTGLGLAIVRRVLETHGGRIEIESQPGAGTVIRVALPVNAAAPPET